MIDDLFKPQEVVPNNKTWNLITKDTKGKIRFAIISYELINPKDKQMRRANSILANYDNVFNLLTSNNNNKKFLNKYLPAVFFVLEYNYKRFQDDVLVYYKHEVKKREKLLKDFINNGV